MNFLNSVVLRPTTFARPRLQHHFS